jgi:hypothetical protein
MAPHIPNDEKIGCFLMKLAFNSANPAGVSSQTIILISWQTLRVGGAPPPPVFSAWIRASTNCEIIILFLQSTSTILESKKTTLRIQEVFILSHILFIKKWM